MDLLKFLRGVAVAMSSAGVLLSCNLANATDACTQVPPTTLPPEHACYNLDLPADLESPDYSFVDTLVTDASYPWAQMTTPPVCIDDPGHKTKWAEQGFGVAADVVLQREAIFQRPKYSRTVKLPLIIWAHPDGGSDKIDPVTNTRWAEPALQHGFAFMSIEFRHPTGSRPYEPVPPPPPDQNHNGATQTPFCAYDSTDIAIAVQWARLHATQLMIDRSNIFLVGQSRGSLSLLTALMPDQIDNTKNQSTDYRGWSSKPNAVFIANGQTTYDNAQASSLYLRQWATSAESANIFGPQMLQFPLCKNGTIPPLFDYLCQFNHADVVINPRQTNPLSALNELDRHDPPVWARYDRTPPTAPAITTLATVVPPYNNYQAQYNDPTYCFASSPPGCIDVHHPNQGVALRNKFNALPVDPNGTAYVNVQYAATGGDPNLEAVAANNFSHDYYCFFQKYKPAGASQYIATITSSGDTRRVSAMQSYLDNHLAGDPPPPPGPTSCGMDESVAWVWNP